MGVENAIEGLLGQTISLGTLSEDQVAQVDAALNPEDNLYTVRFYGRDGELLQEQQLPVQFTEYDAATTISNDDMLQSISPFEDEWETEMPEPVHRLGVQHLELTGDGLNFYGDDNELLWRADGTGMYTAQGTSSTEYRTALNMPNFWQTPIYDADTRIDDDDARYGNPYIRRYVEGELRDRAEEYLRTTYGTRTEQREDFIRMRSRHLDEVFLKGEWKIPEEEEQPDIQDERGGALDEFLEKFTPQKITPERSDEQK